MLSLIFPPIFVFACVLFLVWIFWKKRHLFLRSDQMGGISFRVRAPIVNENASNVTDSVSKEYRSGLGEVIKNVFGGILSFLADFIVRSFHRTGAETLHGKRESKNDSRGKLEKNKRIRTEELSGYENDRDDRDRKERSMISDTVTLPQKHEEKNEYEHSLIERIAINPRDVEAYERLGDYYLEIGVFNDAKECFKQVLRLSQLSRRARFRMRRVEKILSEKR